MARKWIQAADVEISDAGALAVSSPPPTSLSGGTKTCANQAVAEKLVAASTPCRAVWIGPRVTTAGVAQNTKPVFIGDSAGQNIPIMPANFEGLTIAIDNASKLYIKANANGEGVVYRIFA